MKAHLDRIVHCATALVAFAPISCSSGVDSSESVANVGEEIRGGAIVSPWATGSTAPAWTKAIVQLPQYNSTATQCTGTVVQPSWVLTAKHCLTAVGASVVSKRPTGNVTRIVDVTVPNLDPDRDTLMLHLSNPFTDMPQVPLYASTTASIIGQNLQCYGYGFQTAGSACTTSGQCSAGQSCDWGVCMTPSTDLRTATLMASTYTTPGGFSTPDIYEIAANASAQQILPGDSGGPCAINGAIAGVNSFGGIGWGAETSVPASRDYINSASRMMYTVGDFNGDGKKDLIITNASGSYWYYSTGTGTWNNAYSRTDLPLGSVMFTPGDFDGDGKTDVVVTTPAGSDWLYSTGLGTWNKAYSRADLPLHSVEYVVGDYNGDHRADLIIQNPSGSYWYYSTGVGTFNTTAFTRTNWPMGVARYVPGDYNGDGKTDMIVTTAAGSDWYYSTGTGTWNIALSRTDLPLEVARFIPADFNGDLKTDVIIMTAGGSFWYYATGTAGVFTVPFTRTDMPIGSVDYVTGDFNGDGMSDMIISNVSGSYWYYSTGTGTWNAAFTRTDMPWHTVTYTPGDFNGDLKSDMVITNVSGSYWYYSTGTGTWNAAYTRTDLPM